MHLQIIKFLVLITFFISSCSENKKKHLFILSGQSNMVLLNEKEIEKFVDEAINENKTQVDQYKKSPDEKKQKLISFFVGQIMKKSKGKANPSQVNQLLKNKLDD